MPTDSSAQSNGHARRRTGLVRGVLVLGLGLTLTLAAACAKARAETAPDGPPLSVPAPPARVLAPVEQPEPVAATAPAEPPAEPPATPARTQAPRRSTPSPEPVGAQAPSPAEPAVETRELRASPSPGGEQTERDVRDMLARASRDLARVSYARLSADGRDQYDQSRRFAEQAEEALRARNIVFAATLAEKAATLAAELVAR